MKRLLIVPVFIIIAALAGCSSGGGGPGVVVNNIFITVTISADGQGSVEVPASFSRLVQYDGIDAQRVYDLVSLKASLNPAHDELTLELTNRGERELKRLWLISASTAHMALLNPDAVNKKNQGVMVFGPIGKGAALSRKFRVRIDSLPATIGFDCIEVKDRIVYSSNQGLSLNRRNWTMTPDRTGLFKVTTSPDELISQTTPSFSPGMEWILYDEINFNNPAYEDIIYVAHPDGAAPVQVTDSGKYSEQPYFSPTGKEVIYICQLRNPASPIDICTHGIYGGPETDLIRVDGFYWDGTQYVQYAPVHWFQDKMFNPRYTPDGQYITFMAQEPDSAPSPDALANRQVLLAMSYDPLAGQAKGAPFRAGRLIDGDTIASSHKFLGLGECYPSFSPDGKYMFCFLREYVKSNIWKLDFYGLGRFAIQDLLADPDEYIGDYLTRIYDIRNFQSQTGALYINYPEYVPQINGILFNLKWDDGYVDIDIINLDPNMQPVSDPGIFFSDHKINYTPRIPYQLFPGLYKE
jgi:hypothetical protein